MVRGSGHRPFPQRTGRDPTCCPAAWSTTPVIAADPGDLGARTDALRGAWLCGACLGSTTMSPHHKLCHVLGGTSDLPHAAVHNVLLPYVTAFDLPTAPAAEQARRRALATDDVPKHLARASAELGTPRSLVELGFDKGDLGEVLAQTGPSEPLPELPASLRALARSALHRVLQDGSEIGSGLGGRRRRGSVAQGSATDPRSTRHTHSLTGPRWLWFHRPYVPAVCIAAALSAVLAPRVGAGRGTVACSWRGRR
ncbi:iron-containing alcohol dehydrogenase [Streptomyces bottropensis]|uniref:iron-containing alcohol dehydrogenase n=1 Tax=Streptomyces bottropensis TaxID=42235 RepID=UPI0036D1BA31